MTEWGRGHGGTLAGWKGAVVRERGEPVAALVPMPETGVDRFGGLNEGKGGMLVTRQSREMQIKIKI